MREKTIYALGFFDGVHVGHQALLTQCRQMAQRMEHQAGAVTFLGHPDTLVAGVTPPLINTPEDRSRLLRHYKMDTIVELPFDEKLRSTTYESFFRLLVDRYAAGGLVCGFDFRFGSRGEGTPEKLKRLCHREGIPCVVVPEQRVKDVPVSSTYIRSLLERGELETATEFLGHPHVYTGTVVAGRQLGRTMGIPTANLVLPEGVLVPKLGVYACRAWTDGRCYPAVTNVGVRPTVHGEGVTVEPWLLGFDGDLYGKPLTLEFHCFLRPECKFPSLTELQAQIRKNAEETYKFFEKHEKFSLQ